MWHHGERTRPRVLIPAPSPELRLKQPDSAEHDGANSEPPFSSSRQAARNMRWRVRSPFGFPLRLHQRLIEVFPDRINALGAQHIGDFRWGAGIVDLELLGGFLLS